MRPPRLRALVLACLLAVLAAEASWRLAVDRTRSLEYLEASQRLDILLAWHPVPRYGQRVYADLAWDYVQRQRSLGAIELVWSGTRSIWRQTGRERDLARAAWMAVMLQHSAPGPTP